VSEEERLYTAAEVGELQAKEATLILKGVLRNLQEVRAQRVASADKGCKADRVWNQGQIYGLDVAIAAIRRRIR